MLKSISVGRLVMYTVRYIYSLDKRATWVPIRYDTIHRSIRQYLERAKRKIQQQIIQIKSRSVSFRSSVHHAFFLLRYDV